MQMAIHLESKRAPKWILASRHDALAEEFRALGFLPLGIYAVREMPDVLLDVHTHPEHAVVGIITQHPAAGTYAEVGAYWPDGRGLTLANSPMVGNLDEMPGQTTLSFPGAGIARLWKEMKKRLQPGSLVFTKADFPGYFEERYRREMEWRMGEGFSTDEVRRVSEAMGESPDEETIRSTTEAMNARERPEALAESDPAAFEESVHAVAENPFKRLDLYKATGDLAKAIRRAVKGLPEFLATFRARPRSIREFLVRIRFRSGGREFYAWVRMQSEGKSSFTGRSAHAADFGPLKKAGTITFTADRITDWAYRSNGLWNGHHTAGALAARMEGASQRLQPLIDRANAKLARELEKEFGALLAKTPEKTGRRQSRTTKPARRRTGRKSPTTRA